MSGQARQPSLGQCNTGLTTINYSGIDDMSRRYWRLLFFQSVYNLLKIKRQRCFKMSNVTYNKFMKDKYENCKYKSIYGSFEKFKQSRSLYFNEWLEENRNTKPDLKFVNSLARTYINEFGRKASEIPFILCSLERQYSIEVPHIAGILTKEFWIEKFDAVSSC